MTNNKIINIFWIQNKKWLIGLFVISSIIIIASAIIRAITPPVVTLPPPEIISNNKDGTKTNFNNITFSGQIPNFPTELSVAKIAYNNDVALQTIDLLVKKYSLTQKPNSSDYWSGETYSMSKNDQENKVTLIKGYTASESRGSLNKDRVIKSAQDFASEIFPSLDIQPEINKISLISNAIEGSHDPNLDYKDAEIVMIPFTYKIDGFPLFYKNQNAHPFIIAINKSYQLQKIDFFNFYIELEKGNKIPLISVERAVDNINNGFASIIYAVDNNYQDFSKDQLASGNLYRVSLEYRIDDSLSLAYPFYRFSGNIINKNNTNLEAEIITPAIEISK